MRNGKLHFFNGRNTAQRVVIRMPCPLIRQGIRMIQLFAGKRHIRHGLHDIAVAVALADGMAADRVLLVILNEKRFSVFLFALDAVFIRGNFPAAAHGRRGEKAYAAHLGAFPCGRAAAHPVRRDENGTFAHAEHQQICAGIDQNAGANRVVPIIIMGKASQRGFYTANGNRNIAIGFANQATVDVDRAIRASGCPAAGRIYVGGTAALGGGVVVNHAVNYAGRDEKAVIRAAKAFKIVGVFPIRLGEHRDMVPRGFQCADDDGRAEGRVIHIRVAADIDKIRRVPTALAYIRESCRREKKTISHMMKLLTGTNQFETIELSYHRSAQKESDIPRTDAV